MPAPATPAGADRRAVMQYGHAGRHHGTGAPGCPRELHHHHDERCEAPAGVPAARSWRVMALRAFLYAVFGVAALTGGIVVLGAPLWIAAGAGGFVFSVIVSPWYRPVIRRRRLPPRR